MRAGRVDIRQFNRFDMQIDDAHSAAWSKFIGLKRIHPLIDEDTNKMFTAADMAGFTHDHAPTGIKDTPAEHEWSDALMSSWPTIANTVPTALMNAATAPVLTEPGSYIAFASEHVPVYYAKIEIDEISGMPTYHKQWLDVTG